jgi:hypothetical protein
MQVQLLLLPDSRRQSEELALSKSRRLGANDCLDLRTLPHQVLFGADDNFLNRRETAEALPTAMARSTAGSVPFRERIRFATEATQFDTYRNRDLLPLARDAGVHALWFGIEDLTATLINKGQKPT